MGFLGVKDGTTNTTLYYIFEDGFASFSLPQATGKYTVCGPLAQLVEQRTFNPWVVGSSPTGPTLNYLPKSSFFLSISTCPVAFTL